MNQDQKTVLALYLVERVLPTQPYSELRQGEDTKGNPACPRAAVRPGESDAQDLSRVRTSGD